jgi:hypothetical protein
LARKLSPGPATVVGLRWLASVGPAPLDAWAVAMGWGERTMYSHATRLLARGWAQTCPMTHGAGSLIYATRTGVQVSGIEAAALSAAPAPTTWAHCEACAWTAAWLTARGRTMIGPRELLLDDSWRGELEWLERDGLRRRGHRPDLAAGTVAGGGLVPIEVELASKSTVRLRAILALHGSWIAARRSSAVIYICGTRKLAERVREKAAEVGLTSENKTLRIELLETICAATIAVRCEPMAADTALISSGGGS